MASPIPYSRQNALASTIATDLATSIAGKIMITTGVTQGGLGATFAAEIAKYKPALLILAGRSARKVGATATAIAAEPASADVPVRVLVLDLSSQRRVREAAAEVLAYSEAHIDVLMNSAGMMAGPYRTTEEGIEAHFGTNHIGHFLFTNLIMSKILAAATPRVVNVSSDGHRYSAVRFEDVSFKNGELYDQWNAYGQSKTANILFTKGLAEKVGKKGLRAYSLHPGQTLGTSLIASDFGGKDIEEISRRDKEMGWTRGFDFKTLDECAATHVVAAFDPRLEEFNGAYLANGNLADFDVQPTATQEGDVEKLWELSEKLVGESFVY